MGSYQLRIEQAFDRLDASPDSAAPDRIGQSTTPGYIGVGVNNDKSVGVLAVVSVDSGGPAEAAGVAVGDRILEIDGLQFQNSQEAVQFLQSNRFAGDTIELEVMRGTETLFIEVTLEPR
ncbi:PDZ domain-containing protein [Maricaulis salignorans]|uniref:PDZ domain-containing protein n=2 Tax=Maricaulis salignorans TaxID=144026 RepID=A0A1G9UB23_9PROT|nr:PDZ domain-containing protein [Maricaulis salignorans]